MLLVRFSFLHHFYKDLFLKGRGIT